MKTEHADESKVSGDQRGAIHATVMAILSIPAYGFTFLAIDRMAEEKTVSAETVESLDLVFTVFLIWNTLGLFLSVRAILSPSAFTPLGVFAAAVHLMILVFAMGALLV